MANGIKIPTLMRNSYSKKTLFYNRHDCIVSIYTYKVEMTYCWLIMFCQMHGCR